MGEIDAAGDMVSGALLARAVDDPPGGGHEGGMCLNCGTTLRGPHCHRCGQPGHVHRTIGAIWHEILHGVVHFEGRLWNTLPLLILRPGDLTRRYIHGERAHFVSPMAMFLFSVFTMFAALQIMGVSPPATLNSPSQVQQGFQQAAALAQADLTEARAERAGAAAGSATARRLDARIAELESDLVGLRKISPRFSGAEAANFNPKTGWARVDKGLAKARDNPGLALYKLQTNSYKFSWALIPLSIPFVWILFAWRRQYRGYDHAVFVTYSLAFMSLFFIALMIAAALGLSQSAIVLAIFVVPPVHIFVQMQAAYRLRWWSALLRTIVLLHLMTFITLLFGALLLGLGLLG